MACNTVVPTVRTTKKPGPKNVSVKPHRRPKPSKKCKFPLGFFDRDGWRSPPDTFSVSESLTNLPPSRERCLCGFGGVFKGVGGAQAATATKPG